MSLRRGRHDRQTSGLDWIDDLPPELAGQQALLRGLPALCDADDRIRWLVIGCSLAALPEAMARYVTADLEHVARF